MSIFEEFKGFWGTGAELTERAKVLSKAMGLKSEKLTERLVRYYAAEGVLDKPDRLGRDAAYHFRHLLQLLIARRLVDEGVSLVAISRFNLNKSTDELELALLKPSKEEAKAVTEKYREQIIGPKDPALPKVQSDSMSDVLSQISDLKQTINEEAQHLQKTRYQIESLLENLNEIQRDFYKRMENEQAEMKEMMLRSLYQMEQMAMRQSKEFEHQMNVLREQTEITQKEVMMALSKQQDQKISVK